MRYEEITPALLRRAVGVYAEEAYPAGVPSRVKIPAGLEPGNVNGSGSTEAMLASFVDESNHDAAGVNVRWVLRLGNERYPFMKLVLQEYMLEGEFVFAVDTHDAMEIRPNFPDYEQWQALKSFNAALRARIETRWREMRIDTCALLAEKVKSCVAQVKGRGLGRRVLVVDDELDIAEAFAGLLRGEGYDVEIASTGAAGLERASASRPDLVVLDYELPEIDGLQVLARLRAQTLTREIPVLLASASNLTLEQMGRANGFLAKPCSAEVLLDVCAHQVKSNDRVKRDRASESIAPPTPRTEPHAT